MNRVILLILAATILSASASTFPGPQLQNTRVEVVRVLRDALVVDLLGQRTEGVGTVWARSDRLVVLVRGTNSAIGYRYDVWAREDRTREVDAAPLNADRVSKAHPLPPGKKRHLHDEKPYRERCDTTRGPTADVSAIFLPVIFLPSLRTPISELLA